MLLPDANVLIYAFRRDTERHAQYRRWLEKALSSEPAIGLSDLILSTVTRITTHPKIFVKPSSLLEVVGFVNFLRRQPNTVMINPGIRHWDIFIELCNRVEARGNLITDAFLAALAIESGCEWVTADRDFSRFPGLKWCNPLQ
jgi:toxin-antitoxin system PIN domain toxin